MKAKDLLKIYTKDYKNGTYKTRQIKVLIADGITLDENGDFKEAIDFLYPHLNYFSKKVHRDLQRGKLSFTFVDEDGETRKNTPHRMADHLYEEEVEKLVAKTGIMKTVIKRQIIRIVLKKYSSYWGRNHKTNPNGGIPYHYISFRRDKGFEVYDGCVIVDSETQSLVFNFFGKRNDNNPMLKYEYIGTMAKRKPYMKKKEEGGAGGYLTANWKKNKKNARRKRKPKIFFSLKAEIYYEWLFKPRTFIGIDVNKSKDQFVVFSKPIMFFGEKTKVISKKHPELLKIVEQEKLLAQKNAEIGQSKGSVNAKKRRKLRNKVEDLHKDLKKRYRKIALEIVTYLKANNMCICLDTVKTGQKNGSFGQDKIIPLVKDLCEDQRIPHVMVPTPYTTRTCHKCLHVHGKIPRRVREFECEACGKKLLRDDNAAKVIEKRGKQIWMKGLADYNKEFKKQCDKSILKYS
jgi:hypothetical protein